MSVQSHVHRQIIRVEIITRYSDETGAISRSRSLEAAVLGHEWAISLTWPKSVWHLRRMVDHYYAPHDKQDAENMYRYFEKK